MCYPTHIEPSKWYIVFTSRSSGSGKKAVKVGGINDRRQIFVNPFRLTDRQKQRKTRPISYHHSSLNTLNTPRKTPN